MKKVIKPLGYVLSTTALTAMVVDVPLSSLRALASPDATSLNAETDISIPQSAPVAEPTAAITPPEATVTPQFSQEPPPPAKVPAAVPPVPTPVVPPIEVSSPGSASPSVSEATVDAKPVRPIPEAVVTEPPAATTPAASIPSAAPPTDSPATDPLFSDQPATDAPATEPVVKPSSPLQNAGSPSSVQYRLDTRLAEIVERDRPVREVQLRQNLRLSALHYAEQGQLDRARQIAQNPALSAQEQTELATQIDTWAAQQQLAAQVEQTPDPSVTSLNSEAIASTLPDPGTSYLPFPNRFAPTTPNYTVIPRFTLPTFSNASQPVCSPAESPVAPLHLSIGRQPASMLRNLISTYMDWRVEAPQPQTTCQLPYTAMGNKANSSSLFAFPGQPFQENGMSMVFPLSIPATITSGFGWRIHPLSGDRRFHTGIDLGAPIGTPVIAAQSGQVIIADTLGGYGQTVVLEHQNGTLQTLYGHLSGIAVQPGAWVEKGTVIGWVGSTGNSTGPHLHFELRTPTADGWLAIDPMPSSPTY